MDELIHELKTKGVLRAPAVEAAFRAIDRKDFVAPEFQAEAYGDHPLPTLNGQTISQPYTVAFMLDLLDPKPDEKILDIGAGSGWQTMLLAAIARKGKGRVYAIEHLPELCALWATRVQKYPFAEKVVKFFCQDATAGLPEEAPYDKIIAAAAAGGDIPEAWREQVKPGGVIVAPVDNSIRRYTKNPDQTWNEEDFPGFLFVPLISSNKKAQKKNWWPFVILLVAFLCITAVAITALPVAVGAEHRELEIPSGSGSRVIGELLKSRGLIRSKWAFVTYATLTGRASSLKAGVYTLDSRVTVPELVEKLSRGEKNPDELALTVPEGWDLVDLGAFFEAAGLFSKEEFWRVTGLPATDYARRTGPTGNAFTSEFPYFADKPARVGLEGYLYPDTYRIYRNASAEDVVKKMLTNLDRKLTPELRMEIARRKKTIFEVLTVASLLEKEIRHDEERRIVAGILWKRLAAGMPLQVDASVHYALGTRAPLTKAELTVNSPFNTYRFAGLPLGPIANPGANAIHATTFPKQSDYWYYLSTPDGETIFSTSLAEHNRAKAEYLSRP